MYNTVMVIDDSALERFLAETIIKNSLFGKEVISFNAPIDALEYLHSLGNDHDKFPDVIFVDIQMPLMNGFGFLDKYLLIPEDTRKHCKIVMFSSSNAYEDKAQIRRYTVIRKFLNKPLSEQMLRNLDLDSKS